MPGPFSRPTLRSQALRAEVVALVARHRLPTIYSDPAFPKIGGFGVYRSPIASISIAAPPATLTVFCAAKNLVICPFNNPRNIS